ncbi:hypothetical protein [Streptomyces gossypii]|uniref:hypothetical protein n=1 Tax=Streptomyces gossypii TaxID=2883101 RepID=UPI0035CD05DB
MTHSGLEDLLAARMRKVTRQLFQDHLDLRAVRERRADPVADAAGVDRTPIERGRRPPARPICIICARTCRSHVLLTLRQPATRCDGGLAHDLTWMFLKPRSGPHLQGRAPGRRASGARRRCDRRHGKPRHLHADKAYDVPHLRKWLWGKHMGDAVADAAFAEPSAQVVFAA